MFVCRDLHTETWTPDFSSSEQPDPTWTRVRCGDRVIANSLEGSDWLENPVQVVICDACGTVDCAPGNYVHVSLLGDFVLWSAPQIDEKETPRFLRTHGALAIPIEQWTAWPSVPRADALPRANADAVADAWILGPARTRESIVHYLTDKLLGGDTLGKDEAIALVVRKLAALDATESFDVIPASSARIEKLYFDGPAELDWAAFAFTGDDALLVLDREHFVRV